MHHPNDPTVLVVEPDLHTRQSLVDDFVLAGVRASGVAHGAQALAIAPTLTRGVIVTELVLPDLPAVELCRRARASPALADVPIVILTGSTDEIDRVVAFEVGADDYVTKPFSMRELLLRVRRLVRGSTRGAVAAEPRGLVVDEAGMRVTVGGVEVRLTLTEFRVLAAIARRGGAVAEAEVVCDEVWDRPVRDGARLLRTCVQRIRHKLGPNARLLHTVRGFGYRLDLGDTTEPGPTRNRHTADAM